MALYTVQPNSVVNAADINQFTNLLNGTTTGVQITNAGRLRAQLTGATTGTGGYVGEGPALSAPTTGTFVAGDFVSDATGATVWVCKTAGTPGTWSALPTQIATTTLGATSASVTFSGIPAFHHISVYWHARTNSGNTSDNMQLRFNGDSGNNYDYQIVAGLNTTVTTTPGLGASVILIGTAVGGAGTANFFSDGQFTVPGFSQASATHVLTLTGSWYACWSNSAATSQTGTTGGLYTPSAAVTSLTMLPAAGSFVANSVFSVYGWM